ncbi:MAG TPA: SGNH/GDSL hydrolase family protein [Verrucomicrobiae bacterium]|nr:SGNH/GDSL hydrolase family protein [Verrucomicrobiae bacterium]
MKRFSFHGLTAAVFLAVAASFNVFAQDQATASATDTNAAAADPAFEDVADVPWLPNVLLIGDSISMGYTPDVRAKLADRANVHHPAENCGATERGLEKLDAWLGTNHWDVIHFNFGLHDLKYLDAQGKYTDPENGRQVAAPDVYGQNLRMITLRLQKTGAKLIFATTTPVPPGALGRVAGDELHYNDMAKAVMTELNVAVDDLGGYVAAQQLKLPPRPASEAPPAGEKAKARPGEIQQPFNVHFTPEGYDQLSDMVVTNILRVLPPVKPHTPPPPPKKPGVKDGVPPPPPDAFHT